MGGADQAGVVMGEAAQTGETRRPVPRKKWVYMGGEVELNLLYKWHFASLSFQGLFLPRRQLSGEGVLLENGVSGGGALGESAASCGAGLGSRAVRLTW